MLKRRIRQHGFTLVELTIVLIIMGIACALALPMLGDTNEFRLAQAGRMLAADIEFAQHESITNADDPRIVTFDTVDDEYTITTANATPPGTPITDPSRNQPFVVTYGTGRASELDGVTIQSINVGGDSNLRFDAFGLPDQASDATITLACGGSTLIVRIHCDTGEITIP